MDDATLAGYLQRHDRAPAFEGSDGRAYSVAVFSDAVPEEGGYGAALLFVRWSPPGNAPDGHVETDYLAFAPTAAAAEAALGELSLHDVKTALDRAIDRAREIPDW